MTSPRPSEKGDTHIHDADEWPRRFLDRFIVLLVCTDAPVVISDSLLGVPAPVLTLTVKARQGSQETFTYVRRGYLYTPDVVKNDFFIIAQGLCGFERLDTHTVCKEEMCFSPRKMTWIPAWSNFSAT